MRFLIIIALVFTAITGFSQKLYTKSATIHFFSKTSMENIDATNKQAVSIWDVAAGQIEFSVLMKGFEFEKALMQEHFNEDYVESDKYPKATFKGNIDNKNIPLTKDSAYKLQVKGALTMHGVTNQVTVPAIIKVKAGIASATATFTALLSDYKIVIPSVVADKINKNITINISVSSFQLLGSK